MSNKIQSLAPIVSLQNMRPDGPFPLVTITLFTSVVFKKIQSQCKQGLRLKPIIGDLFREGVVISTPALYRHILLDLKPVKQDQGRSVNLYPWGQGPTH